jgi:hypothetical protein
MVNNIAIAFTPLNSPINGNSKEMLGSSIVVLDPTHILVGASGANNFGGQVQEYQLINGGWSPIDKPISGNNGGLLGSSIAVLDPTHILVGASGANNFGGQVQEYQLVKGAWSPVNKPLNGYGFAGLGSSIAVLNSTHILVGAYGANNFEGQVQEYQLVNGSWSAVNKPINPSGVASLGSSIAVLDSTHILVGADNGGGRVQEYQLVNGSWNTVNQPINSNGVAAFGSSIAVLDSTHILGGADNGGGRVQEYQLVNGSWNALNQPINPNGVAAFGSSIAVLDPTHILIGADKDAGLVQEYYLGFSAYDDGTPEPINISLSGSNTANYKLTIKDTSGKLKFTNNPANIQGNNSNSVSITDNLANLQTDIKYLVYVAGAGTTNGTDTIQFSLSDGSNVSTNTIPVTVQHIFQVPTITAPVSITANAGVSKSITGITVKDPSIGNRSEQITLTTSNGGLLNFINKPAGIKGNNSNSVTITDSIANLNKDLANLKYTPSKSFKGNETITITISDLINNGVNSNHTSFSNPLQSAAYITASVAHL